MLNTVTGRILLTAQNQTKSAFSQATKDLRSMVTVAASVGAVSGVAATAVGRAVGEIINTVAQIPVVMLEMDTAFRDSMITQAKFEHQMKAFNMEGQTKGMEDWADNMQYVLGTSDDQLLQTASILARVASEGGVSLEHLTEVAANTGAALGTGVQEAGQRIENASTSAMSAIRLLRQAGGKNVTNELREELQILEDYGDYGEIQKILINQLDIATKGLAATVENGAGYYHQLNIYLSEFGEQLGRIIDPSVQSGLGAITGYLFDVVKILKETPPGHLWDAVQKIALKDWNLLTKTFKQFKETLLSVNWEAVLIGIGQKLGNITQYIIDAVKEIDWKAIGEALLAATVTIDKLTQNIFAQGQKEAIALVKQYWAELVEYLEDKVVGAYQHVIDKVNELIQRALVWLGLEEPSTKTGEKVSPAAREPPAPLRPIPAWQSMIPLGPSIGAFGQLGASAPGGFEDMPEDLQKSLKWWLWSHPITDQMPPGFQHGGPVRGGQPIIVGEAGPELFVPGTSGRIVPSTFGGHAAGAAIGSTGKEFKEFGNTLEDVNKQLDEFKDVFAQLIEPMKQLVMTPGYGKWARKGGNVFWRGGPGGGGPGGGGQFNPYGVPAGSIPPTSIEAPPMGPGGGGPGGAGGPGDIPQFNPYSAPAGSIPPTSIEAPPMGPGGGGPGAGAPTPGGKFSGAPSANANSWMSFLMSNMGMNKTQAAAVTANLMGESGRELNPASSGDFGTAFGTAQWRNERAAGLFATAKRMGVSWQDVGAQQQWFKKEMETQYPGLLKRIRGSNDANRIVYDMVAQYERPKFNNWSQRAAHVPSLLRGTYQEAPKPPIAAKPPATVAPPPKPPITQEQAQARSRSYDPLASYKSAQRIYGEAYQNLTPPAPIKPPAADQPTSTRRSRGGDLARDPVTDSVQPGLAKQRDPMELLQQPRQDVQLGRGKVDLNLKLDRNVNMVRPSIQPAENFDLGVSVDRTGQFFARPGDPTYSGSTII